jgi:hypothetical protein
MTGMPNSANTPPVRDGAASAASQPTVGNVVTLTVIGVFLALGIVPWALSQHWVVGLIVVLLFLAYLWYGIHLIWRRAPGITHLHQLIGAALLMAVVGTAAFSGVSALLARAGWALLPDAPAPGYWELFEFYSWHLLDAIPGLGVSKVLRTTPPSAVGLLEGLPVLLFRAVVVFGLLGAVRQWWKGASTSPPAAAA